MNLIKPILTEDRYQYSIDEFKSMGIDVSKTKVVFNGVQYTLIDDTYSCLNDGELYLKLEDKLQIKIFNLQDSSYLFDNTVSNLLDIVNKTQRLLSSDIISRYLNYLNFGANFESISSGIIMTGVDNSSFQVKLIPVTGNITTINYDVNESNELNSKLTTLKSKINSENIKNIKVPIKRSNEYTELVNYGDIVDYVSLKTNVNVIAESRLVPVADTTRKRGSEITYNGVNIITRGEYSKDEVTSDTNLYWLTPSKFNVILRKINKGDLVKLSIAYKISQDKLPVRWIKDVNQATDMLATSTITEVIGGDPHIYYEKVDTLCKLNVTDNSGNTKPVTFNGYHITFGELAEYSKTILIRIEEGYVNIDNEFIIQISPDSINVYPIDELITEYYITSCKLITKS